MKFEIVNIGPKTLAYWHDEMDSVDMNPSYQRSSAVWKDEDKAYLIDSIINDFDLPKLYFADFLGFANDLNESKKRYAVIDGKQRLTAIFEFMEDQFSLLPSFKYFNDPKIKLAGLKYSEIQKKYPKIIRQFDGYIITTIGIRTNDPEMIIEMFMRLNRGVRLVGSELRNASNKLIVELARNLANHRFFVDKISAKNDRMEHIGSAIKILMMEYYGKPVSVKKRDIDAFLEIGELEDNLENINLAFERAITVLDRAVKVMNDKEDFAKTDSSIPVIYWAARENPNKMKSIMHASKAIFLNLRTGSGNEMDEFRRLSRNMNDAGSIKGRAKIITDFAKLVVRST